MPAHGARYQGVDIDINRNMTGAFPSEYTDGSPRSPAASPDNDPVTNKDMR